MNKAAATQNQSQEEVLNWFKAEIETTSQQVTIHEDLIKLDGDYLYIPVHVPDKDALAVARFLQNIEDKWNDDEPERHPRLLLVPTKD